jgi:two-component system NtrC family response regulator
LKQYAGRYGIPDLSVSEDAMDKMVQYNWPGNVRELQNVIERLAVLAKDNLIYMEALPEEIRRAESRVASIGLKLPEEGIDLEEVEKEILLHALEKHGWNQTHAAKYLNISRKTLIYRMEKFALLPPTQSAV